MADRILYRVFFRLSGQPGIRSRICCIQHIRFSIDESLGNIEVIDNPYERCEHCPKIASED